MARFPVDAPKRRVIKALERFGFRLVRELEHIAMARDNPDGTQTPLTMPKQRRIKGSTLRMICTQAGIPREDFLRAYKGGVGMRKKGTSSFVPPGTFLVNRYIVLYRR
jgi:hypothetical protein